MEIGSNSSLVILIASDVNIHSTIMTNFGGIIEYITSCYIYKIDTQ
jgi:hypothetical protein